VVLVATLASLLVLGLLMLFVLVAFAVLAITVALLIGSDQSRARVMWMRFSRRSADGRQQQYAEAETDPESSLTASTTNSNAEDVRAGMVPEARGRHRALRDSGA